jgi:hypothetical protein
MNRPVGVTLSAIVAIIGSIFALLVATATVASLFVEGPAAQPLNSTPVIIAGMSLLALAAVLGICTGVGLFRLRAWARISILVFAAFFGAGCIFALVGTLAVPLPPGTSAGTVQEFRRTMAIVFGVLIAIDVWWLIQFNTRSTRAAFATPMAELASRRPMSITIIAWASIAGGATTLIAIFARSPLFLFGAILHDWAAGVIYAVFAALSLYIGKGLLDLREEARILGIGWYAFSFVQTAVVAFVPSLMQRMLTMQQSMAPVETQMSIADLGMLPSVMFGFGMIMAAAAIWFLIRDRGAFGQLESA